MAEIAHFQPLRSIITVLLATIGSHRVNYFWNVMVSVSWHLRTLHLLTHPLHLTNHHLIILLFQILNIVWVRISHCVRIHHLLPH